MAKMSTTQRICLIAIVLELIITVTTQSSALNTNKVLTSGGRTIINNNSEGGSMFGGMQIQAPAGGLTIASNSRGTSFRTKPGENVSFSKGAQAPSAARSFKFVPSFLQRKNSNLYPREAEMKKIEEEAATKKKLEEEQAAKKKIEEEAAAKKKIEEEAAAKKKLEEEQAAKKKLEEAAARKQISGGTNLPSAGGAFGFMKNLAQEKLSYQKTREEIESQISTENRKAREAEARKKIEEDAAKKQLSGGTNPPAVGGAFEFMKNFLSRKFSYQATAEEMASKKMDTQKSGDDEAAKKQVSSETKPGAVASALNFIISALRQSK